MVWKVLNNIQNIQKKYSDKQLPNIYFLARTNYLFCAGFFHAGKCQLMQGIFQKENTNKALKYGIYRHLPTYKKIIRILVSFYYIKL